MGLRPRPQPADFGDSASFKVFPQHLSRLFYRYQDLAPQLVPLDYTNSPDVKVPYELISTMPELKVQLGGLLCGREAEPRCMGGVEAKPWCAWGCEAELRPSSCNPRCPT